MAAAPQLTPLEVYLSTSFEPDARTVLLLAPDGRHYHYRNGCLEPLTETAFDLPGSMSRFDLAEIEKLLD